MGSDQRRHEPFALGLVGCGRLAEAGYVPALAAMGAAVRLVAVADPDAGRRARVATLAADAGGAGGAGDGPVAEFTDAASLLAASRDRGPAVDGLVLATPAAVHLPDAERAVAAGVPVLVEKPPAADAAGSAALAALDPAPLVGFNRRFDPGARAVRDAVRAAHAGHLDLRLEIRYRRRSWSAHAVRDEALVDLGPHLVDWARWITSSEVVGVACPELRPERAVLDLTLERGRAHVVAATDRPYAELVEVRDPAGRRLAHHRRGGPVAAVTGRLARSGPSALVRSLAGQLDAFVAAVRDEAGSTASGRHELATAADGHAVMVVIDAARASASRGGEPVAISRQEA
jgi:predicted dehydrogenase